MNTERIAVKILRIGVGMNEHSQVVQINHASSGNKKVFVVPGKYATIEMSSPDSNKSLTIAEVPIGPYGWEYEVLG